MSSVNKKLTKNTWYVIGYVVEKYGLSDCIDQFDK